MGNVLFLVLFGIFENFTLYFIYNTYVQKLLCVK
jgi:hypothetical protein